ncbi:MAG: hypothetical protein IJ666_07345 [Ruminococcus sp.]|nr:hypothetical protein [Ruminococcus sp.]
MKFKKTIAVLAAVTAGSTLAFGQALSAQADDAEAAENIAPVEEYAAPAEEYAVPTEEAAPAEDTASADAITTEAVYESIETETTVAVDSMLDEYGTETTATTVTVATKAAVSAEEETSTTTTIPYLDTEIYDAVDTESENGKAQLDDKDIDYDKIYNDFLYDVVVPNTEGGISDTTESGKPQQTYLSDDNRTEVRVYTEMLGIFAATVQDFCNDGIPELITVTNTADTSTLPTEWEEMSYYPSRITYDLWQYSKADNAVHKVASTTSGYPFPIIYSDDVGGIFEIGKEELSVRLVGDTILEELKAEGAGDSSKVHSYAMYQLTDGYSFKVPYQIAADWFMMSENEKAGGKITGSFLHGVSQQFTNAEEVKAAFNEYGIDADITVSFGSSDADLNLSNIKDEKKFYDYTTDPYNGGVHYNLTDYTGVHGKSYSAPASTEGKTGNESTSSANKGDSPKTGVSFPLAAAGTGAAALAFAVITKKKKD